MALPEDKVCVSVIIDRKVCADLDKVAEELGVARSKVIAACIDSGLDDLRLLRFLGLTPRRMAALARVVDKLKSRFVSMSPEL